MVIIENNWIVVSNDDPSFFSLSTNLSYVEQSKKIHSRGRDITIPARTSTVFTIYNNDMYIPSGLYTLLSEYFTNSKIVDNRYHTDICNVDSLIENLDSYTNILEGITLRSEQVMAVKKMLYAKRCIIQMTTGSGKTEVMCAFVKILSDANNGIIPTVLLIEPTVRLVNDNAKRFQGYDIPVAIYSNERKIKKNHVNICHPSSLGNDINKNSDQLNEVEVMLCDETHHMVAPSFRRPTYSMPNLMYSIGVSASAIAQERVGVKDVTGFSFSELLVIGATGPLVMNVTAGSMIKQGTLATPILLVLDNKADQAMRVSDIADWHKITKLRLESEDRTNLIVNAAKFFSDHDRKVLILVSTRRWAERMLVKFHNENMSDIVRTSFGGGQFRAYNGNDFYDDPDNVFEKYKNGEYTILIGTSHLYEGADIPNLDVIILAYGGRGERLQIQGLGRVLRKTKTGKYAYIVDFTDTEDVVLSKHSRIRFERYKDTIMIPDNRIYYGISIEDLEQIFHSLEDN